MKRRKGPAPKPIAGYAAISPDGDLCISTVAESSKRVRETVSKMYIGGWLEAKAHGWRTCPVAISAIGFKAYRS